MNIKELLINELNKIDDISEKFKERILISEINNDTVQNPIEVSREVVIDYLIKLGLELSDENYKQAEKMLVSMEQNTLKATLDNAGKSREEKNYKIINHLNDLSLEELNSLLNIAFLNVINEINTKKSSDVRYKYNVITIRDIDGRTDIVSLRNILSEYGNKGYKVVSIFTNELGKNAISIGGIGVNSTADEVVVIFEKPIYD